MAIPYFPATRQCGKSSHAFCDGDHGTAVCPETQGTRLDLLHWAQLAEATMRVAAEYEKHAEECRMLAMQVTSPSDKAILENIARSWEVLAQLRKRDPEPATAD